MGDLHIYEVDGMDEYLPKISYYGNKGRIQSFLDGMSAALFPEVKINVIDKKKEQTWLRILNEARKLKLLDMEHDLIIKQMNWYVRKLIHYLANDFVSDDTLYWLEIKRVSECVLESLKDKIVISISDNNNEFIKEYEQRDFDKFKSIENYLHRDYSDKIMAYAYNLSELHNYYIADCEKENLFYKSLGYYPDLKCSIHGKRCYGTGYIDWK